MDPNLEKIRDANMHRIRRGHFKRPLEQARDYLDYILGHNEEQKAREFKEFAKHLKTMKKRLRDGEKSRRQGQEETTQAQDQ